jgi:hypothetical protein
MARLDWNAVGSHFYEAGVDRGVLYVDGYSGVPWNGLTSVTESPSGGDSKSFYIDGVKYLTVSSPEEFEGTITAFTYPDEFAQCNGSVEPRGGLFLTHQRRKTFSLSYRTLIGNDHTESFGYKLHIIYNALASPSERSNETLKDSTNPNDFSWKIACKPPTMEGYKPTSHVVIDSRTTDPSVLSKIEDILYGTDEDSARIPTLDELISVYDTISLLTVIDNGDGTWTATAPFDVIRMLDEETFEITASTAIFIDEDTYTLSSE